jgi:ATP-dependent helicase HrpB
VALPIDDVLPEIVQSLKRERALVLEAPPGAGKTTRVPWALLQDEQLEGCAIAVSEPRRLAAKLAAHFVAGEIGERVGERVGYQVRFEGRTGPKTRIRYLTAGTLLQQLLDPQAANRAQPTIIILDEFHERQIENDQLLALLKQRLPRDENLRLIVMSATLDGERIATYLDCPRIRSEGKIFPLRIEHAPTSDDRPLEKQVSSAVKQALHEQGSGHVLVFLPTVPDIQRCQDALAPLQISQGVQVLALHGEMPLDEQTRAVSRSEQRKVVLATNVAESSITVPGVTAVVDSGLARLAVDSPWSGRRELSVQEVSAASAVQRAGRAGRTAPGVVYRLFTEHNFKSRREHEVPEVQRSDLSDAWLQLVGSGVDPEQLPWFDPPAPAAVQAARNLLTSLGAIDPTLALTPIGRRMLRFSVHPRLARLLVAGEDLGVADDACLAAALLSERDIVRRNDEDSLAYDSDLEERAARFREAAESNFSSNSLRRLNLSQPSVHAVARAYEALRAKIARSQAMADDPDSALRKALLLGFPDRVARRRNPTSHDLTMMNGTFARLSERSVVQNASWLIAHDVERRVDRGRRGDVSWVTVATQIEPDWLLDLFPDRIQDEQQLQWNAEKEQVEAIERISYGSLVLDETRARARISDAASTELARAAAAQKARFFGDRDVMTTFLERIALLARHRPDLQLHLAQADPMGLLALACQGRTSFDELAALDWSSFLLDQLSDTQRSALRREVPSDITLPGGRPLRVHYEPTKSPWVSSRLQDFFGMGSTPLLCNGKVPLTLHLLAPNQRAVQVTTDLAGFWERHYPAIRRELMRRYPRHSWPEDPLHAAPPAPRPRR